MRAKPASVRASQQGTIGLGILEGGPNENEARCTSLLTDIKVEVVREGNEIHVRAVLPEHRDWCDWNDEALLDLVGVKGSVDIDEDSSGGIEVHHRRDR